MTSFYAGQSVEIEVLGDVHGPSANQKGPWGIWVPRRPPEEQSPQVWLPWLLHIDPATFCVLLPSGG